jgi:ABC-type proline/glycine betaine transport system permease subunit
MDRTRCEIRSKYEIELSRLDDQFLELEQQWQRAPRFALFALLAPIVGFTAGFGAAMVELMVTAALVGTYSYLIGVRRSENRWTRASVARELADMQASA